MLQNKKKISFQQFLQMVVKFGHLQKKSRVPFWESLPKFGFEKILIFSWRKKVVLSISPFWKNNPSVIHLASEEKLKFCFFESDVIWKRKVLLYQWSRSHGHLMIIHRARVFQSWNSNCLRESLLQTGQKNLDFWHFQIPCDSKEQNLTRSMVYFSHQDELYF